MKKKLNRKYEFLLSCPQCSSIWNLHCVFRFFVHWGINMFSNKNNAPTLSMYKLMDYSTKTFINNKITWINIILKHTSMINEYSTSVSNNLMVFWLLKLHLMTNPLIRKNIMLRFYCVVISCIFFAYFTTYLPCSIFVYLWFHLVEVILCVHFFLVCM